MQRMIRAWVVFTLVLAAGCAGPGEVVQYDDGLRRELLAMSEADQKVRQGFGPRLSAERIAEIGAVDARTTARLKAIVARQGWPGRARVGEDGAHAAWLVLQHADSAFMAKCLPLMERAVRAGDASGTDYAYLLDRVRMREGKPQVYGTQFIIGSDGNPALHPTEDPDRLDERRRAVGLPTMAEQEALLRKVYR